jgi:phosphate transport system protein
MAGPDDPKPPTLRHGWQRAIQNRSIDAFQDMSMTIQPHDHIVRSYDEERQRLIGEIVRMGEMSVAQLDAALDVVERRDDKAAERIIGNDEAIDLLEREISHDVMKLALRGPLARDLREILAALRIASDIERIGDYAANVAKRSMALNQSPPLPHTRGLGALGMVAAQQVRDVLIAYRNLDTEAAARVRARDAELDAQYTGLFRELLTYMMEDARAITPCTHLLFMAKNIERIGDHATNIAENVWFQVHGEDDLPPREKRDATNTAG